MNNDFLFTLAVFINLGIPLLTLTLGWVESEAAFTLQTACRVYHTLRALRSTFWRRNKVKEILTFSICKNITTQSGVNKHWNKGLYYFGSLKSLLQNNSCDICICPLHLCCFWDTLNSCPLCQNILCGCKHHLISSENSLNKLLSGINRVI